MREFHSNWWGGKDDRLALEGREEYWVREPCSFDCRLCFGGLCYCIECKQDCGGDIFRWLTMGVGRGCDGVKWWVEGCSHNVMWMRTGEVFWRRWKDVMGIVGSESGYVTHTYFFSLLAVSFSRFNFLVL